MQASRFVGLLLLFSLCCILFSSFASASAFTIELNPINNTVFSFEKALYSLTVTNYADADEVFSIHTSDVNWFLTPKPILGRIPGDSSKTIDLYLIPRASAKKIGPSAIPIIVRASDQEERMREAIVFVRSADYIPPDYVPNVDLSVRFDKDVLAKDGLNLDIYLKNRNPLNIDTLIVRIGSDIFYKEYNTSLDPLTESSTKIPIKLDKYLNASEHELTVEILYGGAVIGTSVADFRILPFSDIVEERTVQNKLFKKFVDIALYNDGNVANSYRVKYPVNAWTKIFLSSSEEPSGTIIEDDQTYLVWDVTIESRAAHAITVTQNYRLLVILILLCVLSIIGYFVFRSPVLVSKEVLVTQSSQEGVSGMKVRLYLKNRSRHTVSNIKVIDKVNKIAEVTRHVGLGSLEPTKTVRSDKQGTLVRWDLEMLEPYEERIITYNIKSALKLVGDIRFAAVKVKFDTSTGSERTVYSNDVKLDLE